eukprot:9496898-Pyramimonas_sp.AAC.1
MRKPRWGLQPNGAPYEATSRARACRIIACGGAMRTLPRPSAGFPLGPRTVREVSRIKRSGATRTIPLRRSVVLPVGSQNV